jgi:hypothetical protein
LPDEFGESNSVFKRFRRWDKADVFHLIFKVLAENADLEYAMIEGTMVKVYRSGRGANGGLFGRPLGGLVEGKRPKSWLWLVLSAISCASFDCRAKPTT